MNLLRRPPQPRHVLSAMIFVAVLLIGVRVQDIWVAVTTGRELQAVSTSLAEGASKPSAKDDAKKEGKTGETPPEPSKTSNDGKSVPPDATASAAAATKSGDEEKRLLDTGVALDAAEAAAVSETRAGDVDRELSAGEMEILRQLSGRRDQLDAREKTLSQKQAVLQATEQRIDQKIREMEKMRTELQSIVSQVTEQRLAEIENLVKIYEAMKPKEAARIFQALDMPILLGVLRQMKPARSAPILAEMDPEKAKEVTTALTRQYDLPQADDKP